MIMPTIKFRNHPDYEEQAGLVNEHYDLIDFISVGDARYATKALKPKMQRVCLFCGGAFGEVTFKSDAHLLSKHLGNSDLFSDFECHDCNLKFGRMENDLAKFLGISKSLAKAKGDKMESFKGRLLSAHSRSFIGDDFLILAPKDVVRDGNKTYIRYVKNPYTPVNVYKALVKFALSVLPNEIVKQSFLKGLAFLKDKLRIEHGAALSWYTLPFNNTLPLYVLVFQKKALEANLPTYMMSFYFNNYIINLPLLMHVEDIWSDGQCQIIIPPPYFANEQHLGVPVHAHALRDFASTEKVTDEWEELTFTMLESTDQLVSYDPESNEMKQRPFDRAGIKYMVITKEGVTVDPKAFSQFIKDAMEGEAGPKTG